MDENTRKILMLKKRILAVDELLNDRDALIARIKTLESTLAGETKKQKYVKTFLKRYALFKSACSEQSKKIAALEQELEEKNKLMTTDELYKTQLQHLCKEKSDKLKEAVQKSSHTASETSLLFCLDFIKDMCSTSQDDAYIKADKFLRKNRKAIIELEAKLPFYTYKEMLKKLKMFTSGKHAGSICGSDHSNFLSDLQPPSSVDSIFNDNDSGVESIGSINTQIVSLSSPVDEESMEFDLVNELPQEKPAATNVNEVKDLSVAGLMSSVVMQKTPTKRISLSSADVLSPAYSAANNQPLTPGKQKQQVENKKTISVPMTKSPKKSFTSTNSCSKDTLSVFDPDFSFKQLSATKQYKKMSTSVTKERLKPVFHPKPDEADVFVLTNEDKHNNHCVDIDVSADVDVSPNIVPDHEDVTDMFTTGLFEVEPVNEISGVNIKPVDLASKDSVIKELEIIKEMEIKDSEVIKIFKENIFSFRCLSPIPEKKVGAKKVVRSKVPNLFPLLSPIKELNESRKMETEKQQEVERSPVAVEKNYEKNAILEENQNLPEKKLGCKRKKSEKEKKEKKMKREESVSKSKELKTLLRVLTPKNIRKLLALNKFLVKKKSVSQRKLNRNVRIPNKSFRQVLRSDVGTQNICVQTENVMVGSVEEVKHFVMDNAQNICEQNEEVIVEAVEKVKELDMDNAEERSTQVDHTLQSPTRRSPRIRKNQIAEKPSPVRKSVICDSEDGFADKCDVLEVPDSESVTELVGRVDLVPEKRETEFENVPSRDRGLGGETRRKNFHRKRGCSETSNSDCDVSSFRPLRKRIKVQTATSSDSEDEQVPLSKLIKERDGEEKMEQDENRIDNSMDCLREDQTKTDCSEAGLSKMEFGTSKEEIDVSKRVICEDGKNPTVTRSMGSCRRSPRNIATRRSAQGLHTSPSKESNSLLKKLNKLKKKPAPVRCLTVTDDLPEETCPETSGYNTYINSMKPSTDFINDIMSAMTQQTSEFKSSPKKVAVVSNAASMGVMYLNMTVQTGEQTQQKTDDPVVSPQVPNRMVEANGENSAQLPADVPAQVKARAESIANSKDTPQPIRHVVDRKKQLKMISRELNTFLQKSISSQDEAASVVKSCLSVTKQCDVGNIAVVMVNRVLESSCEDLDMSFTPPAPPLPLTQFRLIALLTTMESDSQHFTKITSCVKQVIRDKLFPDRFFWPDDTIESCIRFYVALCKRKQNYKSVWKLCVDSMVVMKQRWMHAVYTILVTWPDVLQRSEHCQGHMLVPTLAFVILQAPKPKRIRQLKRLECLKLILRDVYNYKVEDTIQTYLVKLMKSVEDNVPGSVEALMLFSSTQKEDWSMKHVVSKLLAVIKPCENVAYCLRCMDVLYEVFQHFSDKFLKNSAVTKNCVEILTEILSNTEVNHFCQESAVEVLHVLRRHCNFNDIVKKWLPQDTLSEHVNRLIRTKPSKTKAFKKKKEKKKKKHKKKPANSS